MDAFDLNVFLETDMKKINRLNAALGMVLAVTGVAQAAEDSYKFSGTLDLGYYRDYDEKNKTGSISRSNVAFDGLKDLGNGVAGTVKLNTRFFLRNPNTKENLVNEDTKYIYVEKKKPEAQPTPQTTKQSKQQQKTNSMYSLLSGLSGAS